VVGRLAATRDSGRLVVLGAHYDTKMNTGSPGANDNGSGTVLVLEMARCLAESPPDMEVMVVFFGGEERLVEGSDLHHFGSRYFVHNLGNDDRSRFRGAIIVDMVGVGSQLYARTMGIGPMNLCNGLIGYAASIGPPLPYRQSGSYSDHEPFERAGLPAVWMEVMDDPYYHSPRDTIDKINPAHLERTGSLLLGFLHSQFFPR
jgi:Zn-dependent M28 family amino/carboxypeptidase